MIQTPPRLSQKRTMAGSNPNHEKSRKERRILLRNKRFRFERDGVLFYIGGKMEYIIYRKFKGTAIRGAVYLPAGHRLNRIGDFLYDEKGAIFAVGSENARRFAARNDDLKGILRGKLSYKIAYGDTGHKGERFTAAQRSILINKYPRFILPENEYLLFSDQLFEAEIEELRAVLSDLGMEENHV